MHQFHSHRQEAFFQEVIVVENPKERAIQKTRRETLNRGIYILICGNR